jgi:hypothetical protein
MEILSIKCNPYLLHLQSFILRKKPKISYVLSKGSVILLIEEGQKRAINCPYIIDVQSSSYNRLAVKFFT